eukprot:GFUD01008530.1.p1 GENE.GFUD01008530.1~~GFUD01008530.1.p1  ORF type:complete len:652 (+),score=157.36 GFUD01008530.1:146-2101(+)
MKIFADRTILLCLLLGSNRASSQPEDSVELISTSDEYRFVFKVNGVESAPVKHLKSASFGYKTEAGEIKTIPIECDANSCKKPDEYRCSRMTRIYWLQLIGESGQNLKRFDVQENKEHLMTHFVGFYSKPTILLGKFNVEKLDCFESTIKLSYSDDDSAISSKYETETKNMMFKLKVKQFDEKKCEPITVKVSVFNIFSELVFEKEFKLAPGIKQEGEISITSFEENSRTFLNFTTNTMDLNCFDQIQIGESAQTTFENPLDVTETFRPSCQKKSVPISLTSTSGFNQKEHFFEMLPSLHPPSQAVIIDALLDAKSLTIQLTTTPPAPLTCLISRVAGTTIPIHSSGRLDIRTFSSACLDQDLPLSVRVEGGQDGRTVLTKIIKLPKNKNPAPLSLVYHEESKTVRVEASLGVLACAGDVLVLKNETDDTKNDTKNNQEEKIIESSSKQFSLSPYLFPCKEAVVFAEYEGLNKNDVHHLTIEHTPRFNITLKDAHFIVDMENEDFKECEDLQYELQCKATKSEEYKSVLNFTQSALSMEEYQGRGCRVRAWIEDNFLDEAKYVYIGAAESEKDKIDFVVVMAVIGSVVFISVLIVIGAIILCVRKKNPTSRSKEQSSTENGTPMKPIRREDSDNENYYNVLTEGGLYENCD